MTDGALLPSSDCSNPEERQRRIHHATEEMSLSSSANDEGDNGASVRLSESPLSPPPRSLLKDRPRRVYSYKDLEVYNLLVHPIWIFDFIERRMRWANDAGLVMWKAESLQELQERSFQEISDASAKRMREYLRKFERGVVNIPDQWTNYPAGKPKTVHMNVTYIQFKGDCDCRDENGSENGHVHKRHDCVMCEGIPLVQEDLLNENLRGVEMLRHLPMAVCQFDLQGNVMFENPEAAASSWNLVETSTKTNSNGDRGAEDSAGDHSNREPVKVALDVEFTPETNLRSSTEDIVEQEQVQQPSLSASGPKHVKLSSGSKMEANTNNLSSESETKLDHKPQRKSGNLLDRFVNQELGKRVLRDIRHAAAQELLDHKQQDANNDDSSAMTDASSNNSIGSSGGTPLSIDLEATMHTRNGPKWCAVQFRSGKDPVTGETVILFSARDMSDALQAQKERKASEQKGEFVAIMAHEIRTPLHQVTGFIDLLDDATPSTNREQKSYLRLLKSSTQLLMTVISDVLDYSKLEAGKMKMECIPYEPRSVVEGSIEAVRSSCEEKNLYLRLSKWNKDIPFKMMGDPNRVRQVLLNLLSNAVKFTEAGGIEVSADIVTSTSTVKIPQRMVRFVVKDTGKGISNDEKALIFNRYHQSTDASVARKHGGTGLGLSICKLLVTQSGGTIGCESEVGQGSLFWFFLPVVEALAITDNDTAEYRDGTSPKGDDPSEGGMNILIVEDNMVNQKLMARMLERLGHSYELAENGQEAISCIENRKDDQGPLDLVLMDIQMPVMDGFEATKRLRMLGYTNLPIYGLTASVKRSDFEELGFDGWISKPVLMKDLKIKLSQIKKSRDRPQHLFLG